MKVCALALALCLAGCGNQQPGNAMTNAEAPDGPMPSGSPLLPKPVPANCAMPKLDLRAAKLDEARAAAFRANFKSAFDRGCTEGLFEKGPLVDPRSADPDTLFVMDAPNANVTSVYFNVESKPPMMFLEAPFGPPPAVPSADEIHEAMYCTFHGATEQEMEESGRCLPD